MNTLPTTLQDRLGRLLEDPELNDPASANAAAARADAGQLIELQRLTQSAAYWDPQHIEHEAVKAKVRMCHELEFRGSPTTRRPNGMILDSGNPNAAPTRQF